MAKSLLIQRRVGVLACSFVVLILTCFMLFVACPSEALANTEGIASARVSIQDASQPVKGEVFKWKGNTYKVLNYDEESVKVELVKFGGKELETWNPEHKLFYCDVTSIGTNAFNNAKGKKVAELYLPSSISKIKKGALKNMTSLTYLDVHGILVRSGMKTFEKGCFNNTGKNKGKDLTLDIGYAANSQKAALKAEAKMKKRFVKLGLSKNALMASRFKYGDWILTTLHAPTIIKVKSSSNAIQAKWTKDYDETRKFEIRYSTKKSMSGAKKITVSKKSTTAKLTRLKGGTKFYVQVRVQIKHADKKLHWSEWSDAKAVKTK